MPTIGYSRDSCCIRYLWGLIIVWRALICSSFSVTVSRPCSTGQGHQRGTGSWKTSSSTRLHHQLNTNLEWLFEERYESNLEYYQSITWHDPSKPLISREDSTNDNGEAGESPFETMPLYPLGATYVPAMDVNHTLNNVEPRNVKMALDLIETEVATNKPPDFCTVLVAADTGRIASVGTVMTIVDYEIQKDYDSPSRVSRIKLICQAQGICDISDIVNPGAFSKENRIRRSPEYLRSKVLRRPMAPTLTKSDAGSSQELLSEQLVDDFSMLQLMYQLDIGMPDEALPPGALQQLGNAMPSWKDYTSEQFWNAAQDWQSLCYTIRQGYQSMLNTERNEQMIAAATAKGGPLKLPIHLGDLDPEVRRQIQEMENETYGDYLKLGLEPCLDFQALISLSNRQDQIAFLSQMISKEKRRVEAAAKQPRVAKGDDPDLSLDEF